MIFVNTKKTAHFLQELISKIGQHSGRTLSAAILTSNRTDSQRDKTIDDFRKNNFAALISTNVLARGIDVPAVDIVINYDIPISSEY